MNTKQISVLLDNLLGQVIEKRNRWELYIKGMHMTCYADEIHNRMRITTFIKPLNKTTQQEINRCMEANFHTALDVKYASSEGNLMAVFIHPLKELTTTQMRDAINQLYSAASTFGTTYSGGPLRFKTKADILRRLN